MRREHFQQPVSFLPLRGSENADVAIAGGGLTGLTAAVWLSRAGLRVALLEGRTVGAGSTAHCMGAAVMSGVSYAHMEKKRGTFETEQFVRTNLSALRMIQETAEQIGAWENRDVKITGLSRQSLEEEIEAMRKHGLQAQAGEEETILLSGMGCVYMPVYLQHLARTAQKQGVLLHEHSRVTAMETNELFTEQGSIRAPYLIVATGYPILNVPGWYFLHLTQQAYTVKRMDNAAREIVTTLDGSRVMAGDYLQRRSGLIGNGEGRQMHTAGEWHRGSDIHTADHLPVIGTYAAKTPNLFVASGYGGRGLIGSMMAAQSISSRILGLPSEGYELYDGSRLHGEWREPVRMGARYLKTTLSHLRAPRCPHMGCRLVLNPYTRLWECPCHGSCFDDIGHVLSAPAVHEAILRNRK